MKLLSKVLALVLSYLVILMIVDSCNPCKNYKYDIDKMSLKNLIYSYGTFTPNTKETDTTVLKYSQFGIRIKFHDIIYSNIKRSYSLINTAMAYDCWDQYNIQHKVDNISVISLNNFDLNHTANSDISEYFRASFYPNQVSTIDSTINYENKDNFSRFYYFDLLLNKAPQLDSAFRFVVKVKLSNNELIDTTELVKILK
jgi:hypothetical protein